MLRQLVCGLVALALFAGLTLAADKNTVTGKFVSYKDGTLTINVAKKGEEAKNQEFKIADDFKKITVYSGDEKKEAVVATDAFNKELKKDTRVKLTLDDDKKVTAVEVGTKPKK